MKLYLCHYKYLKETKKHVLVSEYIVIYMNILKRI